jgi:hypothetical protein
MNAAQVAAQTEVDRAHSWFMFCCHQVALAKRVVTAAALSGQLSDSICREVQHAENSKHQAFEKLQRAKTLLAAVSPKPPSSRLRLFGDPNAQRPSG